MPSHISLERGHSGERVPQGGGESNMTTKAEITVMWPQAKEGRGLPEARSRKRQGMNSFLELP